MAIPVPDGVIGLLRSIQSRFPDFVDRNKHIHLTLKFLGEVQPDVVDKVKAALAGVEFESFEFSLGKFGFFPSEDFIRVVWVGVEPEKDVVSLQQKIDAALKPFFQADKIFKPHLTLARVKRLDDKKKFLEFLYRLKIPDVVVRVEEFRLIQSVFGRVNEYRTLLSVKARDCV